jgi:hypothetical protein
MVSSFFTPQHNNHKKIWRVPIDSGKSQEVAEVQGTQLTGTLAASPDGKLLAYPHTQYGRVPSSGYANGTCFSFE